MQQELARLLYFLGSDIETMEEFDSLSPEIQARWMEDALVLIEGIKEYTNLEIKEKEKE